MLLFSPSKINFKISALKRLSQLYQNFCCNATSQNANSDIRPNAQIPSCAVCSDSPLSFVLFLRFLTPYTDYNLLLRKDERTHCGNIQGGKFFVPLPNKCSASHFMSSSSSSSSFVSKMLIYNLLFSPGN